MSFKRRLSAFFVALLTAITSVKAMAWGQDAHRVIALVAEGELTPSARAQVNRLLAQESGATLASISTWPDEQRSDKTSKWHYVNFPEGTCKYVPERDCPDGACVVEATQRQIALLQSHAGDAEKLIALKYVVHLVADVHQPLHAGRGKDRGGNSFQVQFFERGTNLHALWDIDLVKQIDSDQGKLVRKLKAMRSKTPEQAGKQMIVQAAEESCAIANSARFYPSRTVDNEYVDFAVPIAMDRMRTAASRLAAILNSAF